MSEINFNTLDLSAQNRFIQFEVWKDCKNGCDFCFNRGLSDVDKIESLEYILEKLQDEPVISKFNEIGFIGGEFFDGQLQDPLVKQKFYSVFDKVLFMLQTCKMKKVYITSSLILKKQNELFDFFDFIKSSGQISKFLLCTSYDTICRFKKDSEQLWIANINDLKKRYSQLKLHVEIIITQDFIEKVLSGKFDIKKFQKEYNVTIDFLEPNTGSFFDGKQEFDKHVPNFLPKRSSFIEFLKKTCIEDKSIELFKLFSKNIRSDLIFLIMNGKHKAICGRRHGSRTLGMNLPIMPKFGYIDSDIDIASDVEAFRELYG